MPDKKRILFFYSDMGFGGIQRVRSILSKALSELNKYELYLAVFENDEEFPFSGKVIKFDLPSSRNPFKLLRNIRKRMKKLKYVCNKYKIDLILSSSIIPNFISLLAKKKYKLKVPLIVSYHNSIDLKAKSMGFKGKIIKYLNLRYKRFADKVVGVSQSLVEQLKNYGYNQDKLVTIHNPIDLDRALKTKDEEITGELAEIFNKNIPVLLSVGRLVSAKNYSYLIDCFNEIRKKNKCKLVILGDGEEKEKLKNKISEYKLDDDVFLPGFVQNPFKYMNKATVYVLSSEWEGLGNVLVEAMICSLPIVANDCPVGPNEIIENEKSGILVPVGDKQKMVDSIMRLISDKQLQQKFRENGLKRAQKFSLDSQSKKYSSLFDSFF